MMTSITPERDVLAWLGREYDDGERCAVCGALCLPGDGHVADRVPIPQEGGHIDVVYCRACIGDPDAEV